MRTRLFKCSVAVFSVVIFNSMGIYASDNIPDNINQNFDESKISIILDDDPIDVFVDQIDKDIYGGLYYENDIPHIIATSTENKNIIQNMIQRQRGNISEIIVDDPSISRSSSTIYSMNELYQAQEQILDNLEELEVIAVGINSQENALTVYFDDFSNVTDEMKEDVIFYSEIENILFRSADDLVLQLDLPNDSTDTDQSIASASLRYTVRGGNKIVSYQTGNWSTLTTSAVYDYGGPDETQGFLTCGHGWTLGEQVRYQSRYGNVLGTVLFRKEGGTLDYSFIESSQNSNGYMTDGAQLSSRRRPCTGLSIKVYGAKTYEITGSYATGTIEDINISGNWGGYSFSNLFLTTAPTASGDSGGAFVSGTSSIVGIMKGAKGTTMNNNEQYINSVGVSIYEIADDNILPSC